MSNYERTTRQRFVFRYDFLAHNQGLGMLGSTSNIYFRTFLITMSADQDKKAPIHWGLSEGLPEPITNSGTVYMFQFPKR